MEASLLPPDMWRVIAHYVADGVFPLLPGEQSTLVNDLVDYERRRYFAQDSFNPYTDYHSNYLALPGRTERLVLPALRHLRTLAQVCRATCAVVDCKAVALCLDGFCRMRLVACDRASLHPREYVGNADADPYFSATYWRLLLVEYEACVMGAHNDKYGIWRFGKTPAGLKTLLAKERQRAYKAWKESLRIDWTRRTRRKL